MRKISMRALMVVVVCSVELQFASAQTVDNSDDPRVAQISQLIGNRKFYSSFEKLKPDDFCTRFINDLQAGKNIEFVKPTVTANTFDDPAIAAYAEKCPKQDLKMVYQCDSKVFNGLDLKSMTEDEIMQWTKTYCETYEGSSGFRIYELPAANGKADGHFVFYKNDIRGPLPISTSPDQKSMRRGWGQYDVINTRSCKQVGSLHSEDASYYYYLKSAFAAHGVVKYGKDYFLFSVGEIDGFRANPTQLPNYSLELNATDKRLARKNNLVGAVCAASTISAEHKFAVPQTHSRKP